MQWYGGFCGTGRRRQRVPHKEFAAPRSTGGSAAQAGGASPREGMGGKPGAVELGMQQDCGASPREGWEEMAARRPG